MKEIGPVNIKTEHTAAARDTPVAVKKALVEFESLFINEMLKSMRETVNKTDLFHGGSGEDMYNSMFDMELSKIMASAGGIGLEKALYSQLLREYGMNGEDAPREHGPEPFTAPHVEEAVQEKSEKPAEKKAGDAHTHPMLPMRTPLEGRVSSNYGYRKDPFTGELKFHHGIDIAANAGSPVYPVAPGKVVFSGVREGYGNVVEVLHGNGVVTRYGHNSKNLVREGALVNVLEPIAQVGSTGRSTGPHLHFEVLRDGVAVNPGEVFYG